jgi:hypothetical protein
MISTESSKSRENARSVEVPGTNRFHEQTEQRTGVEFVLCKEIP